MHNLSRCTDVCMCCEFANSHERPLINYYLYQSSRYFYLTPKLDSTAVSSCSPLAALYCNCSNATHRCKKLVSHPPKTPTTKTSLLPVSDTWNWKCINSFHWQLLQNSMMPVHQLTWNAFPYVKLCLKHTRDTKNKLCTFFFFCLTANGLWRSAGCFREKCSYNFGSKLWEHSLETTVLSWASLE